MDQVPLVPFVDIPVIVNIVIRSADGDEKFLLKNVLVMDVPC